MNYGVTEIPQAHQACWGVSEGGDRAEGVSESDGELVCGWGDVGIAASDSHTMIGCGYDSSGNEGGLEHEGSLRADLGRDIPMEHDCVVVCDSGSVQEELPNL